MDVYDRDQSWQWNLENAPSRQAAAVRDSVDGSWLWCGLPASSPLGIPAGPLLNARWLLHYADRGFDILVYKTVRSIKRDCYLLPNLVPVEAPQLSRVGETIPISTAMNGSWAVSFGMPSQAPSVWREDVAFARKGLPTGKLLVVSVVGTQDESLAPGEASLDQLANDFAQCARWAMDSGAHGVEANFSCPNVSTADGQLYQQPAAAGLVAERIRERIGSAPLVLKIGYSAGQAEATELLRHVGPFINGLAMTNSIAAKVSDSNGDLLFDGQRRGICGDAIRNASIDQVRMFRELLSALPFQIDLIGVGGISTAAHVRDYLSAGATSVAIATAAMLNPNIALPIREQLHGL